MEGWLVWLIFIALWLILGSIRTAGSRGMGPPVSGPRPRVPPLTVLPAVKPVEPPRVEGPPRPEPRAPRQEEAEPQVTEPFPEAPALPSLTAESARDAIVLMEILGPPVSRRGVRLSARR